MERKFYSIGCFLVVFFANSQSASIVINEKLLFQITKNQAVRLASNQSYFNSYEKQQNLYNDIKTKMAKVIAIQEFIYDKLRNVNAAILQSKKLVYLYQDLDKMAVNAKEMLSLSQQHPEYAVLISNYYFQIGKEILKLNTKITESLLNENKDYLMDPSDREMLLENIYESVQHINGNILYINMRLKNAKKIPYLYQIPVLKNFVSLDKMIVSDILQNYKYIFK